MTCEICNGTGWVCENHPFEEFDHDNEGCDGAGKPCVCNPEADTSAIFAVVYASTDESTVTRKH